MRNGRNSWNWRDLLPRSAQGEVDEELAFHLEERIRDGVEAGLDREAAREAALRRLGDLDPVRRECVRLLAGERRAQQGRVRLRVSILDVKLGVRMLRKYPGLTVVGGIAIAFAIWVGASGFEIVHQAVRPTLPLPGGERMVGIRVVDGGGRIDGPEFQRSLLHGPGVQSVDPIGAFRTERRNLVVTGEQAEPVEVARITASGLRMAHVSPQRGRLFDPSDENPDALGVLIIGHGEWQGRFGGDPGIVGRTARLGGEVVTIVGVMPPEFAFPVAHSFWIPFRGEAPSALSAPSDARGATLFGRLADGYDLAAAEADLTTLAGRFALPAAQGNRRIGVEVLPYPRMINNVTGPTATVLMLAVNLFLVMLLILACGNVALLMFARAVTREQEIAVRGALGASRSRIALQMFVEAFLLAGLAALVGLGGSRLALERTLAMMAADGGPLPFWFDARLSPRTLLYALGLTVLAAAIAGLVPALQATGRNLQGRLRRQAGGGERHQIRGVWTVVIVAQVAATLVFPSVAFLAHRYVGQIRHLDLGFPSHAFLAATLEADPGREGGSGARPDPGVDAAFGEALMELKRRLAAEPGVRSVTFADHLPRSLHDIVRVEVEGVPWSDQGGGARVGRAAVDLDFFGAFEAPILAGRPFGPSDLALDPAPLIVNEAFANQVLQGANPVGMRVRTLAFRVGEDGARSFEAGEWREIVGLVRNLGVLLGGTDPGEDPAVYHPAQPGDLASVHLALRTAGGRPEDFAARLRSVAAEVDPSLRLEAVLPLDDAASHMWLEMQFLSRLLVITSAIALLLSLAAIYSVTAFAVTRRTREIGVRVALGAGRPQILRAVLLRPLLQVGAGVLVGSVLVTSIASGALSDSLGARQAGWIGGYAILMLLVCAGAAIVPVRRALRVQPTEAMRAEP